MQMNSCVIMCGKHLNWRKMGLIPKGLFPGGTVHLATAMAPLYAEGAHENVTRHFLRLSNVS